MSLEIENKHLRNVNQSLIDLNHRLSAEIDRLAEERKQVQARFMSQSETVARLVEERDKAHEDLGNMTGVKSWPTYPDYETCIAYVDKIEKETKRLETENASLTLNLQIVSAEKTKVVQQLSEQRKSSELFDDLKAIGPDRESAKCETDEAQATKAERPHCNGDVRDYIIDLERETDRLYKRINNLNGKVTERNQKLLLSDTRGRNLQTRLDTVKKENAQLRGAVATRDAELLALRDERARLLSDGAVFIKPVKNWQTPNDPNYQARYRVSNIDDHSKENN